MSQMYGNPVSRAQTMVLLADTARHRGRHPQWWLPALLWAIAACRPDAVPEDSAGTDASSAPAIVSAVPASLTLLERVELTPVDASGIAGEVVVLATRVATRLDLEIHGGVPQATLGAYLGAGRCANPGRATVQLGPLRPDARAAADASNTVDLPPHRVLDGQHYVAVYQGDIQVREQLACGDLPLREDLHPDVPP